jgi:hypothetical protein
MIKDDPIIERIRRVMRKIAEEYDFVTTKFGLPTPHEIDIVLRKWA